MSRAPRTKGSEGKTGGGATLVFRTVNAPLRKKGRRGDAAKHAGRSQRPESSKCFPRSSIERTTRAKPRVRSGSMHVQGAQKKAQKEVGGADANLIWQSSRSAPIRRAYCTLRRGKRAKTGRKISESGRRRMRGIPSYPKKRKKDKKKLT